MCGYFGTVLTVLYPEGVVDELVDFLIGLFDLPEDVKVFCLQQFLPEMRMALNVSEISLTSDEFFKMEGNFLSTIIKLLYAFLWQVSIRAQIIYFFDYISLSRHEQSFFI